MRDKYNNNHNITSWYVIHTHSKQEDRADLNLRAWGVTTFNPKTLERVYNPYSHKAANIIKPLFPRYMFARFNINKLRQVHFTRGVHKVVCFGDDPIPVDDAIIAEIRSREGADGYICLLEELTPGDEVIIREGPMKNFKGIFIGKVSADDRVRILLHTVSFQAHLETERAVVRKFVDA
jgi:transcriptional antiterminator RfaH